MDYEIAKDAIEDAVQNRRLAGMPDDKGLSEAHKIICKGLIPITEHPDVQRLIIQIQKLKFSHDKLVEALRLFIKVKELKDEMNECIDERKEGLLGILVMSDELAKKYQGINRERQNLKLKVYLTIKQALKEAGEL